jgi:hypothetical protein
VLALNILSQTILRAEPYKYTLQREEQNVISILRTGVTVDSKGTFTYKTAELRLAFELTSLLLKKNLQRRRSI